MDIGGKGEKSKASGLPPPPLVTRSEGSKSPPSAPVVPKIKSPAEAWAASRAQPASPEPAATTKPEPAATKPEPSPSTAEPAKPPAVAPVSVDEPPAVEPAPKAPAIPPPPTIASAKVAKVEPSDPLDDEEGTIKARPLDPVELGVDPAVLAKPKVKPKATVTRNRSRKVPRVSAPAPITSPVRGEGTIPKDPTLTRVRLTDAALADPESIDRETSGVQVIEQVRLEPGELVTGTRYRIVGWLGEGGMGVVYECEHVDIERRVALKILRQGVDPNSRRARMFREEARAVSRAGRSEDGQVSNIVEIYDFGELPDGRMWFAMELLHGRSLARMLSEGPMDAARLIGVLRQLCKGLGAAHDANVIHRDIKPGNVMLVRDRGRDDVVKVVDFGVAAVLAEGDSGDVQLEGTPNYMAPEQATGSRFDHRLDIYAVGAVGFHMLAGGPPFQGDDVFQLLRKVCTERPPRPSELNPEAGIPSALEEVILRCLEKDPKERYADMRDLEAALCEAQISARLVTAWDDLPLPKVEQDRYEALQRNMPKMAHAGRPRRTWALVAAAALVAGLTGWGVVAAQRNDETAMVDDRVTERMEAARDAAARALFLYPSPDDPEARTAYVEVVDLEKLAGDVGVGALEAAGQLRSEFGGTLVRLGDRYWDRPGGRPFAVDYYIAALVFDPKLERARERAPITPGALAELTRKASTLDFEAAELTASEPLLALAEDDEHERVRKLEVIGSKGDEHGVQGELRIQKLLEDEGVEAPKVAVAKPRKPARKASSGSPEPIERSSGTGNGGTTSNGGAAAVVVEDDAPVGSKEVKRSAELVDEGLSALRSGNRDKAETLFNRALDRDHRNHRALDGLAQVYFARGGYQQAVEYGKKAVAMAPDRGSYRIRLGDAYFKVFRYAEAEGQYRKAQELGHKDAQGRLEKVKSKLGR